MEGTVAYEAVEEEVGLEGAACEDGDTNLAYSDNERLERLEVQARQFMLDRNSNDTSKTAFDGSVANDLNVS
jgi:hypothetical protein